MPDRRGRRELERPALAAAFGLRRADVAIVTGTRGRDEVVALRGEPAEQYARLTTLLRGPG